MAIYRSSIYRKLIKPLAEKIKIKTSKQVTWLVACLLLASGKAPNFKAND